MEIHVDNYLLNYVAVFIITLILIDSTNNVMKFESEKRRNRSNYK